MLTHVHTLGLAPGLAASVKTRFFPAEKADEAWRYTQTQKQLHVQYISIDWHEVMYIHGPQLMNPNDVGDPLTV